MPDLRKIFIQCLIIAFTVSVSHADLIDFDDYNVNICSGYSSVSDYGGFQWNNGYIYNTDRVDSWLDPQSGYFPAVVSGEQAIVNGFGDDLQVMSDEEFNFLGANLTAAWNDDLQIEVQGYNNGELLYSETVTVSTGESEWFDFNFNGVDELVFSSFGGEWAGYEGCGTHFAMDNFTYSTPEPGTCSLMLISLLGIGGVAMKRKKEEE